MVMAVNATKDVLFGGFFALTLALLNEIREKPSRGLALKIAACGALAVMLRNNMAYAALVWLALLTLGLRKAEKSAALAMLLALAVGGVAYTVRRGVLNFTEDFGFAPMVSQDGAERLVTSGSLAHIELERTIIDVREAVYDGAELRIVYSLTDRSGELHLAATVANGYEMPGYDAGETQICDYVLVNGQNVDFDQAWEVPGDAPGQMLYYLQTNLSAWRAELADAKTLDIRLPMLQNGKQVAFSIPAAVPAGMILSLIHI